MAPASASIADRLAGRRVALLQGPSSRFFTHLGRALRREGAGVTRIGFCPADRVFWSRSAGRYLPYRGGAADFGPWLKTHAGAFTDIVMLGDGREAHRAAIEALKGAGIRLWVVELGYLRPNLLTIWQAPAGPVAFPEDQAAPDLAAPVRFPASFLRSGALDLAWHAVNLAASWATYPAYRTHALDGPVREYAGWALKGLTFPARRARSQAALARIAAHEGPIFLVPLQLDTDFQLRLYGTGRPQAEDLSQIVTSFAAHAPGDALLVVKLHPLDNGLRRWGNVAARIARDAGVGGRMVFLDGGAVEALYPCLTGVVTINSTVGLSALLAGLKVKALGKAIYDRSGLTDPAPLDAFWTSDMRPDPRKAEAFHRNLRHFAHVPGAFDGPGALAGAANIAGFLAGERA